MRTWMLAVLLWSASGLPTSQASGQSQTSPSQPPSTPPAVTSADSARIRREIETIENSLPKIPDRGAALYLLARRHAQLGELPKALALLKECIALDEGFDPSTAPAFEALRSDPEFRALVEEVRRRYSPIHQARVAFTIEQQDPFPEGLAVDADRQVFYMGSMHHKKILKITKDGQASNFVKEESYGLLPLGGIKVDAGDHSVWAASDDGHDSELLHFDSSGRLQERFRPPGEGPHVLNDLVLRHAQQIYVTDSLAHVVYRFDRRQHSFTPLTFPRPLLYPNGIALSDDENQLYVADMLGVIRLDLTSGSEREVTPGAHNTLAGIDGLYWYKGSLLGVQYGTGTYRVARWQLSPDGTHVTSSEILERGTPLVSFPTTGAILGREFYFIANTGIANLKDDKVVDPKKLEVVHIAVVPLK